MAKQRTSTMSSKAPKIKKMVPKRVSAKKEEAVRAEKRPIVKEKKLEIQPSKKPEWIWATGKRKTAVAQVRYSPTGKGEIKINNKPLNIYFPWFDFQQIVIAPLKLINQLDKGTIIIRVHGGGQRGQAEAIRLGISRALQIYNPELRPIIKPAGFLTRDARIKERKKPGLKRARRAPQWSKR